MTKPAVVAHAGGAGYAPANTLGALRRTHREWPGIWMEIDGQLAADGELVVIHDPTLDRTTDATGPVSARTADELARCNAAAHFEGWESFEPVPRLREVLGEGAIEGWHIVCELKNIPGQPAFDREGERYAQALAAVLDETAFPVERLLVISFWAPTLDAVRARLGGISTGLLSAHLLPNGSAGPLAADTVAQARRGGYEVAAPEHTTPDLGADLVLAAHQQGIAVHVWTLDATDDIRRAVSIGVDAITSNYPDRVLAVTG